MKKFLGIILCVCLVLSVCIFSASAEYVDLDRELIEDETLYLSDLESKSFDEMIAWAGDDLVRINAVVSKLDEIAIPAETSDDYVELDTDGIQAFSEIDPVESWAGTVTHNFGTGVDTYDDDQDLIQDVLQAREENDGIELYAEDDGYADIVDDYGNKINTIISDPTNAKWYNSVCKLVCKVDGYDGFVMGSGFWISDNCILTAAHCVFNNSRTDPNWQVGTWVDSMMIIPCYIGNDRIPADVINTYGDSGVLDSNRMPYGMISVNGNSSCTVDQHWLSYRYSVIPGYDKIDMSGVYMRSYDWAVISLRDCDGYDSNAFNGQMRRPFAESNHDGLYTGVGYPCDHNCKYTTSGFSGSSDMHFGWGKWCGNFGSRGWRVEMLDRAYVKGMSGGPVFDWHGYVVGIVVSMYSFTETNESGESEKVYRSGILGFDDILLAKFDELVNAVG